MKRLLTTQEIDIVNGNSESMTEVAGRGMDAIRDDIATLRSDLSDLIRSLAQSGVRAVKTGAADTAEKASEIAGIAKERVGQAHQKLAECTAARPVTYLALAFAAGAIASRLMAHRR